MVAHIATETSISVPTRGASESEQKVTTFVLPHVQPVVTGLTDLPPTTEAAWRHDVPVAFGGLPSDEARRVETAFQGHITILGSIADWKRIPSGHGHPQLLSEPDD